MKGIRSLALAALLAAAAPPCLAVQITTATPLAGSQENPPNASPGTGFAVVTLDTTAHQLRVSVNFSGLTSNTTMAHIHCCVNAPANVGVATTVPAFVGFPLGVTSGSLDQIYDTTQPAIWNPTFVTNNGGTPLGAEAALAAALAAGRAYFNIHTVNFPPGEIRGFLVPQQSPNIGSIPTLTEWGLIALAALVAATAFAVLRRRTRM